MGLDFSYLLYFQRMDMWKVLKGLSDYTNLEKASTQIDFPDHSITLPLEAWCAKDDRFNYDDPDLGFILVMNFPVDAAIFEYLSRHGNATKLVDPSLTTKLQYEYIGCIYLSIREDLQTITPDQPHSDLVLFDFGTTGTRMSLLFSESDEIRNTFMDILDNYDGVCGVFNRESEGEVFWFEGRPVNLKIVDPYLSTAEIRTLISK